MSNLQTLPVDARLVHWDHTYDPTTRQYTGDNCRPASFADPLQDLPILDATDKWPDRLLEARREHGLTQPLLDGWNPSKGGTLDVEPLAPELVDAAIQTRRRQIELWEAAGAKDPRYMEVAATMRDVWQLGEGETPVRPEYVANMGYRRSYGLAGMFTLRRVMCEGDDWDRGYEILVKVVHYTDPLERLIAHYDENMRTGSSQLDPVDHLAYTRRLMASAGTEADLIRSGVKKGTAQKLIRWCRLASQWPSLQLVDRALAPPPELEKGEKYEYSPGGWIPFRRVDKEATQALLVGDKKLGTPPPSCEDEVEAGLVRMLGGRTNAVKMLTREALENARENNPTDIVRDISAAVLDPSNKGVFSKLATPRAAAILNAAYALSGGKLPTPEDASVLLDAWQGLDPTIQRVETPRKRAPRKAGA